MRIKLIAFDLDGVLVAEPSAWWTLHKAFGTYETSKENLRTYEAGNIDYPEFMRRDIRLWGTRNIKEVQAILLNFILTDTAPEICSKLRQKGYQLAIVSAGIDILARAVSERLGIEHWAANGLAMDSQGFLTGEGIFHVDLMKKHLALEKLVKPLGLVLPDIAAVGDSKYDIPLMKACGAGIAFIRGCIPTDRPLWAESWPKIYHLEGLPRVLFKIDNGEFPLQ
jgi:phosphoserine phosphatase